MRLVAALAAGLVFGAGLSLSRMIDPAVVLAFLDVAAIADGSWNPALAFVMAGAVLVTAVGYALIFHRRAPLLAATFAIPGDRAIDRRLIAGAITFGMGWGLVGYCPGPAIAGLGFGLTKTWLFVGTMLVGMALHHIAIERRISHGATLSNAASGGAEVSSDCRRNAKRSLKAGTQICEGKFGNG